MSDTPLPPTDPAPLATSRGALALAVAQAEWRAKVTVSPPGSETGPRVRTYLAPCVRGGKLLGLTSGNYCAAFASWCLWTVTFADDLMNLANAALSWTAASPSGMATGYRAAVSELYEDARATGAWHDIGTLGLRGDVPGPGDFLVFGRNGADPRVGGTGHVVLVEAAGSLDKDGAFQASCDAAASWVVISGNGPGGAVARETRTTNDRAEPLLGWIAVG